MFKRTAAAIMLFTCSSLATAQQPTVAWPWMPMQIWAVPANGQAMPFPTPFWLWVAQPAVTTPPAAKTESPPPSAATAAPAATAPSVTPPPAAEMATASELVAVTPAPTPAVVTVEVATEVAREAAAESACAKPTPIRMAPVAKPKLKSTRAGARNPRKLCFKDGKLDICQ